MNTNSIAGSYSVAVTVALVAFGAACGGQTRLLDTPSPHDAGTSSPGEGADAETRDASVGGKAGAAAPTPSSGAGAPRDAAPPAAGAGGAAPSRTSDGGWYIKASNPDAQDWFGTEVALSSDWLAVGAPNESSRATGVDGDQRDDSEDRSGAVYLFTAGAAGFAQRQYLKASNTEAGDGFGYAIALSGRRLAIGAPYEDSAATGVDGDQGNGDGGNHGAVYVFSEDDGAWQQEAYLKASNTDWIDLFGTSVALDNDVLVVGAPWEDSAANAVDGDQADDSTENSGAVYVFTRTPTGWVQSAYLKASNAAADAEFGRAVAISGETIAVGAPGESSGGSGVDPALDEGAAPKSGAVYLFEREGASYRQSALLKASNADTDDAFGSELALDAATLVVGAIGEATSNGDGSRSNEALPESGAVYVFERSAGSWKQTAYLKPSAPAAEVYFGSSLAVSGDTLLVGAFGEDRARLPLAGAAYVFGRAGAGWKLSTRMLAPNAEINDRFGAAVALSPDFIAIGATGEASDSPGVGGDAASNRTPGAGAVFAFPR